MKNLSPALLALLATRQFWVADLYTFTLIDGTILRYTSADQNLTVDGNTYSAGGTTGPYFKREGSEITWKRGLEVDQLNFTVLPGPSGQVNGMDFLVACRVGLFDYAELVLERAFMPTFGDVSAGTVILFDGLTGEVQAGRSNVQFTINSWTDILNMNSPRNLYQAGCINTLFDGACSLVKASFAVSGSASSGSTATTINATLSQATGYFDLGSVLFTSGANDGITRSIKTYTHGSPSQFVVMPPLPYAPAASDTFTIYPGCDKTQATCNTKFSNLANFRGFPFVPVPETAV